MEHRPTGRELTNKLKSAAEALRSRRAFFANPAKTVKELYDLEIGDASEVWDLLCELLQEIVPEDYAGKHPPERSYEKTIAGKELLAFVWRSRRLNKTMYVKFAMKDNQFAYVSLHAAKF